MEPSVFFQSLFSTNVIPNLLLLSRPQCLYFIVDMTKGRKCRVFGVFFSAAVKQSREEREDHLPPDTGCQSGVLRSACL